MSELLAEAKTFIGPLLKASRRTANSLLEGDRPSAYGEIMSTGIDEITSTAVELQRWAEDHLGSSPALPHSLTLLTGRYLFACLNARSEPVQDRRDGLTFAKHLQVLNEQMSELLREAAPAH